MSKQLPIVNSFTNFFDFCALFKYCLPCYLLRTFFGFPNFFINIINALEELNVFLLQCWIVSYHFWNAFLANFHLHIVDEVTEVCNFFQQGFSVLEFLVFETCFSVWIFLFFLLLFSLLADGIELWIFIFSFIGLKFQVEHVGLVK